MSEPTIMEHIATHAELRAADLDTTLELAEALAAQGHLDDCTETVRSVLAQVEADCGLVSGTRNEDCADALLQALQLLTVSYTAAGAITHSQQICAHAISLCEQVGWVLNFENAIQDLDRELIRETARELDQKWQDFFARGDHFVEIETACMTAGLSALRDRVRTIHEQFLQNPDYRVPADEALRTLDQLVD